MSGGERARDGVGTRRLGERGVERGIEHRHLRHARAQHRPGGAYPFQRERIVQWRERNQSLDLGLDGGIDQARTLQPFAAMHHAVGGDIHAAERVLVQETAQQFLRPVPAGHVVPIGQSCQRPVRAPAERGQAHRRASRVQRQQVHACRVLLP